MRHGDEELDWDLLLDRIEEHRCTPFLGAGSCFGALPMGSDIAQEWAHEWKYPLEDTSDLARVAQYLAVTRDPMWPKGQVIKRLSNATPPDFDEADEPHGVLAGLPLPVYMTTNYDDFLMRALRQHNKDPQRELCRWNRALTSQPSIFARGFEPTPANPVVFHLHGHLGVPESIVLTEDDYLDFLVQLTEKPRLLPPRIQEAISNSSLLFLGYKLADWDFRVVFRNLAGYLAKSISRVHVSVQLEPQGDKFSDEQKQRARRYLEKYFRNLQVQVYWGSCREFMAELRQRWEGR